MMQFVIRQASCQLTTDMGGDRYWRRFADLTVGTDRCGARYSSAGTGGRERLD